MSNKEARGCVLAFTALWTFGVTMPMWLVMVYQVLAVNDVPPWVWSLYYCYIPAGVISGVGTTVLKSLGED